jgi:hypothetical protein
VIVLDEIVVVVVFEETVMVEVAVAEHLNVSLIESILVLNERLRKSENSLL